MKAFSVYDAVLSKGPSSQSPVQFGYPGCLPTISANGTADAIVWVLDERGYPARLRRAQPGQRVLQQQSEQAIATRLGRT